MAENARTGALEQSDGFLVVGHQHALNFLVLTQHHEVVFATNAGFFVPTAG